MALERKNILIIDDSDDARILFRRILEAQGCTVFEADSVSAGVESARSVCPHLIILDLKMPGESGFDFLHLRLTDDSLKVVPVVVASQVKEKVLVSRAIALKASDYLVKPIDTKTVLQKVRKNLKDNSFFRYSFKEGSGPKVSVKSYGAITHIHESGMKIQSPVKLKENTKVQLKSHLLDSFGLSSCSFSTTAFPSFFDDSGQYESRIMFAGTSNDLAKDIRKKLDNFR
ncbi:MAG: hypothetical protein CL677_10415 [Bdellovibrionaceae bacterium]|nr:hypothetical protein [Pseudobdellovibrionaceae bacterium]|tara:strand:+ start:22306 stop:22992 length:687 start_codon:yes stop_codon:yes gene_type:complete